MVTSFENDIYAVSSFLLWDGHLYTQASFQDDLVWLAAVSTQRWV